MESDVAESEYGIQIDEVQNDEMNLSNFAQYSLIPVEDMNLLEAEDIKYASESMWQSNTEISAGQEKCADTEVLTPSELLMLKEIDKMLTQDRMSSPCVGQGDGPNTSLLTPTDNLNFDESLKLSFSEEPKNAKEGESETQQAVYATLEPAKMSCVNFSTPQLGYHYQTLEPPTPSSGCEIPKVMTFPERKPLGRKRLGATLNRAVPLQVIKPPILSPYNLHQPMMNSSGSSVATSGSTDFSFSPASSSSPYEGCKSVQDSDSSLDYPKPPSNTPTSEGVMENMHSSSQHVVGMNRNMLFTPSVLHSRLEKLSHYPALNMRENHNAKERKRRSRIRDACQEMRRLLPGMNDRLDNATVFEMFADYIDFMREQVGDQHDMEFLCKYQE